MSGHHAHDEHDTHEGAHHEPETSSDDFPADEPHSPAWLPLLGGGLLLAGILAFVIFSGDGPRDAGAPADSAATPTAIAPGTPAEGPATARPALR